jgi:5-enolpyruvylshikimate-3-phosphate synthase
MRFLTALAALVPGEVVIDGEPRMRERPIGPLLDALRALGVDGRVRRWSRPSARARAWGC